MKKNDLSETDTPQSVKDIRDHQLKKLNKHIDALSKRHSNIIKKEDIPGDLDEQTNYGNKHNAVTYFIIVKLLIKRNAEDSLKDYG